MKIVDIIGVPLDIGASKRGVDMGPSAIRYTNLYETLNSMEIKFNDLGNIEVPLEKNVDNKLNIINKANENLYNEVKKSLKEDHFPLILGGDHSIAVGSVMAVQSEFKNIGVFWVDCHGDFNNLESSPSGNYHGMPLSACTGFGPDEMLNFVQKDVNKINPKNVVLFGARDLDKKEVARLKDSGITVYTIADIDKYGVTDLTRKALDIVEDGTNGFHLSFDLDVINPSEAPGVGTAAVGGLTYREAHLLTEIISDSEKFVSAEIVELNPILDIRNQTGELAKTLITSILGKKIY